MEPWARELLDVWTPLIPQMAQDSMQDIERLWVGKYTADEVAQMIHGARMMMEDDLENRTSDLRETYFQTVIPGLAAQGESVSKSAAVDLAVVLRVCMALIPALKSEHRAPALSYFIGWQARFIQDLVVSSMEAGAKA